MKLLFIFLIILCTSCLKEKQDQKYVKLSEAYPLEHMILGSFELSARRAIFISQKNHFCVIGYDVRRIIENKDHSYTLFYVYWKEEETLFWPWADRGNFIFSQRSSKLGKDTAQTEEEISGFTHVMLESEWHEIVHECEKYGESLVIEPASSPEILFPLVRGMVGVGEVVRFSFEELKGLGLLRLDKSNLDAYVGELFNVSKKEIQSINGIQKIIDKANTRWDDVPEYEIIEKE